MICLNIKNKYDIFSLLILYIKKTDYQNKKPNILGKD